MDIIALIFIVAFLLLCLWGVRHNRQLERRVHQKVEDLKGVVIPADPIRAVLGISVPDDATAEDLDLFAGRLLLRLNRFMGASQLFDLARRIGMLFLSDSVPQAVKERILDCLAASNCVIMRDLGKRIIAQWLSDVDNDTLVVAALASLGEMPGYTIGDFKGLVQYHAKYSKDADVLAAAAALAKHQSW